MAALAEFNRYSASKDGYDKICRVCWGTYEKTRRARKAEAAGEPAPEPKAKRSRKAAVPAPEPEQLPPSTVVASGIKSPPQYADELAVAAGRGRAKGYTTETIGGLIYALPEAPEAVGSPEGQAALARCNEARATERRRRDAERKREERARKKASADEAAQA
jgi:hypothetical protein